jgi:hypothetical protein
LPDQAIGIFIGAALTRSIRITEIRVDLNVAVPLFLPTTLAPTVDRFWIAVTLATILAQFRLTEGEARITSHLCYRRPFAGITEAS